MLDSLAALVAGETLRVVECRNPCGLGGCTLYAEAWTADVSIIGVNSCAKNDRPLRGHKTRGLRTGDGHAVRSALRPGLSPDQKRKRRDGKPQHQIRSFPLSSTKLD